ncbi:MAG: ornithine carbamoyltransferase, partial [Planctomycetota bacterium]
MNNRDEKPVHLVTLLDWTAPQIRDVLDLAHELKARALNSGLRPTLERRTLALLFQKSSMRTRVSFEVAMTQLGGHCVYLSRADVSLGVREPIRDGARVLSRYVDGIAARVYSHATVAELAAHATVPVINALSDAAHPCQALADALTIEEKFEEPGEARVTFIGDANNVARSLAIICARLGLDFTIASPPGYGFGEEFSSALQQIAANSGATVRAASLPAEAAEGADVLY